MTIFRCILLRIRNVSDKICRENQNKHFMLNNFFRISCRLWDNVVGPERPPIIRRMLFACWASKATRAHAQDYAHSHTYACTRTHTEIRNTYCFSTLTVVTLTPSVLRYTYIVCLVLLLVGVAPINVGITWGRRFMIWISKFCVYLLFLYLTVLLVAETVCRWMIGVVTNELERMWKETVVTYSEVVTTFVWIDWRNRGSQSRG